MSSPLGLLPVVPVGGIATSSLMWRWGEHVQLTIVAKARFALQQRATMTLTQPSPVTEDEVVPYRHGVDVVVTSAHAHSSAPTELTAVRLAVVGTAPLIDKSLLVYAPRPGGVVAPFVRVPIVIPDERPGALVVDPKRPGDRGTLGPRIDFEPLALDASPLAIEAGAWDPCHIAPADQRVAALRGDEWVVLDGMTHDNLRVESRLPAALIETRLFGPDMWCGRSLQVRMQPTLVSIDADGLTCSLVWQGACTVESIETPARLTAVSALHLPSLMTTWPSIAAVKSSAEFRRHLRKRDALAKTDELVKPNLEIRPPADAHPQLLRPLSGRVCIREHDPHSRSITDSGTLDLPPDRNELAPPRPDPLGLVISEGAPWLDTPASHMHDVARRGAGGTVVAEETPPDLDKRDVDTLEQSLTDSLDEMRGDATVTPAAEGVGLTGSHVLEIFDRALREKT